MAHKIYSVDLDEKVTPIMVRDAVIRCFKQAHEEVLEEKNLNQEFASEDEREAFEKMQVEMIISSVFEESGVDFNNPTKEGIMKALDKIAEFASQYRKPEIIKKHYNQIMQLVNKL